MSLKELKKGADALNKSDKLELLHYPQSRITGMTAPTRAIDEIQEQKHKEWTCLSTLLNPHH